MPRIVFREDGCQILDEQDRVLFAGGYADCERYLDVRENLQVLASRRRRRAFVRAARRDPVRTLFAAVRLLFRRVPG